MVKRDPDGSTREANESSVKKLDNFHYCLRLGCKEELTKVDASHEKLLIHFECKGGHKGSKCLTELAG